MAEDGVPAYKPKEEEEGVSGRVNGLSGSSSSSSPLTMKKESIKKEEEEEEEDRKTSVKQEIKKEEPEPDDDQQQHGVPEAAGNVKKEEEQDNIKKEEPDEDDDDEEEEADNVKKEADDDDDEEEEDGSQEEDEEDEDEEATEEEEEEVFAERQLRARRVDKVGEIVKHERRILRQLSLILKKDETERTAEESSLLHAHPKLSEEVARRARKRKREIDRKREWTDTPEELELKCDQLSAAIARAHNLVVYTGAGVSTAANIPDYRGPNGVWTLLDQGKEVAACDPVLARPTYTHLALFTLYKKQRLKHVVSQNCDGLHMRSGLPRSALSELHGNMYVEICKHCKPMRPFVRLFDVTQRTNKNRHTTLRRCYVCGNSLYDTIVHFGERGSLKWPINWKGAARAADKADVILCLGSSLKVLRSYPMLWCMDRPPKQRPQLYIVNLQWTPKDSSATLKLNGRCDDVMRRVMHKLKLGVPDYYLNNDPLFSYATALNPHETHTCPDSANVMAKSADEPDPAVIRDQLESVLADHGAYTSPEKAEDKANGAGARVSGRLSRRAAADRRAREAREAPVTYRDVEWPRDALYLPYETTFEYIEEDERVGEDAFCCDCCDPAKRRKRKGSESCSEDEDDDEEEDDEKEEEDAVDTPDVSDSESRASSASNNGNGGGPSSSSSSTSVRKQAARPGWFGKGKKRSKRC